MTISPRRFLILGALAVLVRVAPAHAATLAAGANHTCAVTAVGGVRCWGDNSSGQLGAPTPQPYSAAPVQVTGLTSGVVAIAAGQSHPCALLTGGGLKCWGGNSSGQLGDGTTTQRNTPVDVVGFTTGAAAIAAGANATCAMLDHVVIAGDSMTPQSNTLQCWGDGGLSQSVHPTTDLTPQPLGNCALWIHCGLLGPVNTIGEGSSASHSCVALIGGAGSCWGPGGAGQLGNGMNDDLNGRISPQTVQGGFSFAALAPGASHTCAVLTMAR